MACGRFGFDELAPEAPPQDADVFDAPRGMPGVDTDGDNVFDDTDNCLAMTNVDQHDEDGDGYGDVCDNCPSVPNTSQAHAGDSDAVGDACDPRPTQPGDAIVFFEPFNRPMLGSDWSVVNGAWTMGSDDVVQASLVSDQRMHEVLTTVMTDYIIETRVTFTGFDTANVNAGTVHRMIGGNGWLCAIFHDDSTTPVTSLLMLWTLQNGAANFERASASIPEVKVGDSFRLLSGAYGSNQYCAIDSLQNGTFAPFFSNKNASGIPGLRTNRTTNTYEYFVVYSLGGPI
jgi:hypothetical protein